MTIAGNNLSYILPEIIVAITGGLILILDLIWPAGRSDIPNPRPWLAYTGIAGLAAAGAATLWLDLWMRSANAQGSTIFEGIIVLDPLGLFFKMLFIGIA